MRSERKKRKQSRLEAQMLTPYSVRSAIYFKAPKYFLLSKVETRTPLIEFIQKLREAVLVKKRRVTIDFRETVRFFADGTLLFFAELDRIGLLIEPYAGKEYHLDKVVRCRSLPRDAVAAQVLQQLNLLSKMGRRENQEICDDTVKYWNHASGEFGIGSQAAPLLEHYVGKIPLRLQKDLGKGVTEAMANCVHHAYAFPRKGEEGVKVRKWWMFSEERDGMLTVAFCDLGVGIRSSLRSGRRWNLKEVMTLLRSFRSSEKDSLYIRVALKLGTSSTHKIERGKGFSDIMNVIRSEQRGNLRIYSDNGFYEYQRVQGDRFEDFKTSIKGTIITWSIPIGSD